MRNKYFNNSIISILILSFVLTPTLGAVSVARAQSISGYTSGLAPMITKLPQCKNAIDSGIKTLFNGVSSLLGKNSSTSDLNNVFGNFDDRLDSAMERTKKDMLNDMSSAANSMATGVDVNLPDATEKKLNEIKANTEATRKSTDSINKNSTCIQSIGRLIIKMLLQKMTVSTVAWINSGFDGSPAFIQDPGKFFNDIAKNEILQFGLEIENPELFPFGKVWMQNTAAAFNNKFQDNARYSLNELIKNTNPIYSAETFQQDFGMGGWEAWSALTQVPANNPFGFKLMADNEIQARLAGTSQSVAENVRDALQEANDFLGDQRCVEPEGITKQQDYEAKVSGDTANICKKWEYVTPGKMISDKATEVMGYQNNAYLNVEDLNDAVAAILDALLGQFSSNIMEKGFANIGNDGADGTLVYSSSDDDIYKSQTEKDFSPTHLTNSWLSSNPEFNIRTDLNQALIDEQRTYIDKLELQNKELLSTTDGKEYKLASDGRSSNAYGLVPVIWQLDYCIPGPHPGWEEDSRQALDAATNTVLPETKESLKDKKVEEITKMAGSILPMAGAAVGAAVASSILSGTALGATIGSAAFPVVGTIVGALLGTAISFAVNFFTSDDDQKVAAYYAMIIKGFTGYLPNYGDLNDDRALNLASKQGVVNVLNVILSRYADIIYKVYYKDPKVLPAVSKEAAIKFNQIPGYLQMEQDNKDKIASLQIVIDTLGEIKDKVDELNAIYPDGGSAYEDALKDSINAFGRLSSSMVNGDDIATADNLLKQTIDEKNYIYTNLLKGPYGCEASLMEPQVKFTDPGEVKDPSLAWSKYDVTSVRRMTYPFSLLYDYSVENGDLIPNPLEICNRSPSAPDDEICKYDNNKIVLSRNITDPTRSNEPQANILGPGFLSFVFFSAENNKNQNDIRRGPERLRIHDLLPQKDDEYYRFIPLGLTNETRQGGIYYYGGPFETMIGIY